MEGTPCVKLLQAKSSLQANIEELSAKLTEGLFRVDYRFLQPLRIASRSTSPDTGEAHYRPTIHLKGVTHYTLQARCVKKGQRNFTFSVLFRRGGARGRSQNAPTKMIFCR